MAVTAPISPRPVIGDEPDRLPAYVSNGMIGLRVLAVPLRPGLAMLNGLSAIHPVLGVEYSPQAPYPLAGDLEVNGVRLSVRPECARLIEQRYDFSCAELVESVPARARRHRGGRRGVDAWRAVRIRAWCCQEVAVEVSRSCELALTALVATERRARPLRGASGRCAIGWRGGRGRCPSLRAARCDVERRHRLLHRTARHVGCRTGPRRLGRQRRPCDDLSTACQARPPLPAPPGCGHGAEHAAPTGRPAGGAIVERSDASSVSTN